MATQMPPNSYINLDRENEGHLPLFVTAHTTASLSNSLATAYKIKYKGHIQKSNTATTVLKQNYRN